jgi:hypothetical protein
VASRTKSPKLTVREQREVDRLDDRVTGFEQTQKFMYRVQMDQLGKAERLRKLVMAYAAAERKGLRQVDARRELIDFAKSLLPFYAPPRGKKPALLRRWDKEIRDKSVKGKK